MASPVTSSATTTRDGDVLGRSFSRRTANLSTDHSQPSTSKSRMPRTVNTVPVWARHDDPSPPPSPKSSSPDNNSAKGSDATTLPRQPKSAHIHAKDTEYTSQRRKAVPSTSSSDEGEEGPSRFWSLSKRRGRGGGGAATMGQNPSESNRRPSLTNFTSTLGGAFSTMTSTLGGKTARQGSTNSDDDEKKDEQGDVEPSLEQDDSERTNDSSFQRRSLNNDVSFTRNQPMTPGWESPWHPETADRYSIEFGNYRYNNHGERMYLPRSDTNRSFQKGKKQTNKSGMTIVQSKAKKSFMTLDWWKRFLLDNPFVPLLFRFINIAFTTSTLAIAIRLRNSLRDQGAEAAVGSSPLVAIIFAPFTLVHVIFQIWLEYFSRPIGLWEVGSKLFYTLIDLLFVCLWSAELAIAFDNYFTSTLVCTAFDSPYASNPSSLPTGGQQSLDDPNTKPSICALQRALIGLVFVSLAAYVVVLIVSLYRIMVRISRR